VEFYPILSNLWQWHSMNSYEILSKRSLTVWIRGGASWQVSCLHRPFSGFFEPTFSPFGRGWISQWGTSRAKTIDGSNITILLLLTLLHGEWAPILKRTLLYDCHL
jgi:hypothetical protein